jgi:D-ribose pyranase
MLINGIINPNVLDLISRIRHTNTLVIADAAFPYWPQIETVDLALVRGVPTIIQVLDAILPNFKAGPIYMAQEFRNTNPKPVQSAFAKACRGVSITFEPHLELKKRVPQAIGLIRTGDTTAYGNIILTSV